MAKNKKRKKLGSHVGRNRQAKTSWGLEDIVKDNKTSNPDKKARGSRKQGRRGKSKKEMGDSAEP